MDLKLGLADGMGSFLVDNSIVLVRNHEIVPQHGLKLDLSKCE